MPLPRLIGLETAAEDIESISGNSLRAGPRQDLLALNVDLASVTRARGTGRPCACPFATGNT